MLLTAWHSAEAQPAVLLAANPQPTPNQKLILTGRYRHQRQFLLDNRRHKQQLGYDVYTPFLLAAGGDVVIHRGWIAAPLRRIDLPDISLDGEQQMRLVVRGYVRKRLPPVFGEVAESGRWPVRIQIPDIKLMADLAALQLTSDMEMRLLSGQPGALQVIAPVAGIKPEKHQAYALQWFAFAVVALVLWLVLNTRVRP